MLAIWTSDRCCTLALPAIFGAFSPPRPSSPWHPEQVELKARWPGRGFFLKSLSRESPCCAGEKGTTNPPAHNRSEIAINRHELRMESMGSKNARITFSHGLSSDKNKNTNPMVRNRNPMERGFISNSVRRVNQLRSPLPDRRRLQCYVCILRRLTFALWPTHGEHDVTHFCLTAIAEISIRASLTRAAA